MSSSAPTRAAVLHMVEHLGPPGTPMTTSEIAKEFDCTDRTIYNKLDVLVDHGDLETKKVGARGRVWWRPVNIGKRDDADDTSTFGDHWSLTGTEGEMAHRIREFEWAKTPLGSIEEWPPELRFTVELMVGASHAIGIYWGQELTFLYNDAAIEQIGEKHPEALGRPASDVFPDARETLGEIHAHVMSGDAPVRIHEQALPLERNGELQDSWWGSSFNPIPTDDGSVGGVFTIGLDVTDRILAEQEMREAKEQLALALGAAEMGTWTWDLEERTITADETMLSLFDLPPTHGPIPVNRFLERMSADGVTQCEEVMNSQFNPGEVLQDDIRLDHVEDGPRWVTWRGQATTSDPSRLRGVSFDVTDRKQDELDRHVVQERLESDLVENQKRLDAFVRITSEAVYRMSPDWSEMYSLDGQGFIVDTQEPRGSWLEEYIPPEERERVMAAIEEAIETRTSFELEHQVLTGDGTRGWTHSRAVPILDETENIVEWFGTATDITERKHAEQERRENEAKLAEILARLPLGVGLFDADGIYELQNDRLVEIIDGDLLPSRDPDGQKEWSATDDDGDPLPPEEWPGARALRGENVFPGIEFKLEREGETLWFDVAAVPFEASENRPKAIGVVQEITDRKRQEVELRETQAELAAELKSMRELQEISTALIQEDDLEAITGQLLDAAIELMNADFGSVQLYDREQHDLELIAHQGFNRKAEWAWSRVRIEDKTSCGKALRNSKRVVIPDIEAGESVTDSENLKLYRQCGIRAMQSTPLVSRGGDVLGMFSTHWADVYEPSERDLHLLDILARQLADLIQQKSAVDALYEMTAALERLNGAGQDLIHADPGMIQDRTTDIAQSVLEIEYVSLWRYDERAGELDVHDVQTAPAVDADRIRLPEELSEAAWQSFIKKTPDLGTNVPKSGKDDTDWGSRLQSYVLVPLGRHGVLCAGSVEPGAFDDRLTDLAETVGATIEAAWDRAESEAQIANRNAQLERLDQLNALIRGINKSIVKANDPDSIKESVCARLAGSDLFAFAWIGEQDHEAGVIVPQTWAGVDDGYLENLRISSEERPANEDPIAAAIRTGEIQVVRDIATDVRAASWRETTLERGARSCVSIPLVFEESPFGVLTVYAERPRREGRDTDVLVELGETIAHALAAVTTKMTLQTDNVTELTLEIKSQDDILQSLALAADATLELEGFIPRKGDSSRMFFRSSTDAAGMVQTAANNHPDIGAIQTIREEADTVTFEATVTGSMVAAHLVGKRCFIRSLIASNEGIRAVVDLPPSRSVRAFVNAIRSTTPQTELLGRSTRERRILTRQHLQDAIDEELTARQHEVVETAYRSGFFESPRNQTGRELANRLDISQSTFTHHLREGERRVFEMVFDTG